MHVTEQSCVMTLSKFSDNLCESYFDNLCEGYQRSSDRVVGIDYGVEVIDTSDFMGNFMLRRSMKGTCFERNFTCYLKDSKAL